MKVERVLSLLAGLEVTNIEVIDGVLTISAVSTNNIAKKYLQRNVRPTRILGSSREWL